MTHKGQTQDRQPSREGDPPTGDLGAQPVRPAAAAALLIGGQCFMPALAPPVNQPVARLAASDLMPCSGLEHALAQP